MNILKNKRNNCNRQLKSSIYNRLGVLRFQKPAVTQVLQRYIRIVRMYHRFQLVTKNTNIMLVEQRGEPHEERVLLQHLPTITAGRQLIKKLKTYTKPGLVGWMRKHGHEPWFDVNKPWTISPYSRAEPHPNRR